MNATNVILDLTALILALAWMVGFFVYALVGTPLDVMPALALIIVVTRNVRSIIRDRKRSCAIVKLADYDAEH